MSVPLYVWDFDGTLVDTYPAAEVYKSEHPSVLEWQLWHDPNIASEVAINSLPNVPLWRTMLALDGEHIILTGREPESVEFWMALWGGHPEIGKAVRGVQQIVSVSDAIPGMLGHMAIRKLEWLRTNTRGRNTHFYDDSAENIEAAKALPWIQTHLVSIGKMTTASSHPMDPVLQQIYQSLRVLQDLEHVTDSPSYKEVFQGAVDTLKCLQRDLLEGTPTAEILHLIQAQLQSSSLTIQGDLVALAARVDRGDVVRIEVDVSKRLESLRRMPGEAIRRALHSTSVQIEATFDRLSIPLVAKVVGLNQTIMMVDIWKLGGDHD